nr:ARID DNA-binding domain-containing protein [Tanacetum cinerariifolium]
MSETKFVQRQIKREKENRIGRCIRKITRECKNMLKKKIEDYNSSIIQEKHKQYNCFNCNQKGHVYKAWVHYAPEITLNILSMNLLKQQGFEIKFEDDRCTLKYMFKDQHGQNLDVNMMRKRHNDYLDDYFGSLDSKKTERKEEVPRFVEDTNPLEVQSFNEFVAFLNLIKDDDVISRGWDTFRDAEKKGKETLEHFGIKLKKEDEVCKNQQEARYEKDRTHITCYKCKDLGHYAYECPRKIRNKEQARITSDKASTSKHS